MSTDDAAAPRTATVPTAALHDNGASPAPEPADPTDPAGSADPTDPTDPAEPADPTDPVEPAVAPSWWHRDHPVFTPLAGFFTGLLCVFVVPAAFAGLVSAIAGASRAESLFPFVLVFLAVPLALVCFPRTRRFGGYLWLGIVTTAVVVVGVGGLVLWYMVSYQS